MSEAREHGPGGSGLGVDAATQRDRDRMRLAILLLLAGLGAYAILRLLAPFTLAIVTSGVAAVLTYPVFRRARGRIGHGGVAAGVVTVGVFLLVVVPLAGLLVVLTGGIESSVRLVAERVQDFTEQHGEVWSLAESVASAVGIEAQELSTTVEDQLSRLGSVLAGGTLGVLSGVGTWLVQAGIGLFTLFYLLRDGESFLDVARWVVPLERDLADALFAKTEEVVTATVLGTLLVAAAQGIAGGLLFWALDIPGAALWGAVMAFLGLLPMVGPPVVWIPAALVLLSAGRVTDALVLTAVGGLVISTLDNVLRAILVGERAQLHSLVVFFSVLGGVIVFGAAGFLFGPVLVVVAFAMLEIARVALAGDGTGRLADDATILSSVTTANGSIVSATSRRPENGGLNGTERPLHPYGAEDPKDDDSTQGVSPMVRRTYDLEGKRVAILATHGFQEAELTEPLGALRDAGAEVKVISLPETSDQIKGWADGNWAKSVDVDATVSDVTVEDFDALVLPGGLMNPDRLRADAKAVSFVQDFFDEGKPVAAICHGPWLIAEADAAAGRRLTSYPSIRTDLENAGAEWVDEEVVVDEGLVTSRSPADMEAFIAKMLEEIHEGIHAGQHA